MTTPPQQTPSPHLPRTWSGGALEGHEPPDNHEWHLESWAPPEWVALMATWEPLEPLAQGDPPESWGTIDLGSGGAPAGPRQTEARSGAVVRISATLSGVILDDHPDEWLNLSRYGPPVDLRGVHTGDIAVAEIEKGGDGRAYLTSIRVLPLDGPAAPEAAQTPPGGER